MPTSPSKGRSIDVPELAETLKHRILTGVYGFGERLIEMDLAAEFSVGRGRVREAFRLLVGQGYLEFVANRGVLVRSFSRADMIASGQIREVLEGLSARLAAERTLTTDERKELEATQAALDTAEKAGDLARFADLNRNYHLLIERLAGNDMLGGMVDRVRIPLVRLQLPEGFGRDSLARSNLDHRTITMAILTQAPDVAEAAMRAHVRAGNAHIATLPDAAFADVPSGRG